MRKTTGKALVGVLFLLVATAIMASIVMAEPEYGITYTPETIFAGKTMTFHIVLPSDLSNAVYLLVWDLGDSTRVVDKCFIVDGVWLLLPKVEHTYQAAGTYLVKATLYSIVGVLIEAYSVTIDVSPLIPFIEDTESYIEYVNTTIQELPNATFIKPEEDIADIKYDFSDKFNDILENIDEETYERAIEHLEEIRAFVYEQVVPSDERQEIIDMVDALIAYLKTL